MADDIIKKITIEVEMETDEVTKDINNLNSLIADFLTKQKTLTEGSKQNAEAFTEVASKLEEFQKKLKEADEQVTKNTASLNMLNAAGKSVDNTLSDLSAAHQKNAKSANDSTSKTKDLTQQLNTLGNAAKQQSVNIGQSKSALDSYAESLTKGNSGAQQLQSTITNTGNQFKQAIDATDESKSSFDAHKMTMDHLKKSFDEVKDVSGIFGPSLKDAAQGFNVMNSGLKLVKDGVTGVGTAIKADGFDFLLQILQLMFDAFVKSSKGSKELKGAISAIGVIVTRVNNFFAALADTIIIAVTHPVQSIKEIGQVIQQNIINRLTAFGLILDGVIHLDFKKITNGAVQALTGITNATGKISTAFTTVKKDLQTTAAQMVAAYKKGYNLVGKEVDKFHSKVTKNGSNTNEANKKGDQLFGNQSSRVNTVEPLQAKSLGVDDIASSGSQNNEAMLQQVLAETTNVENKKVIIKKSALQQVEDYAKQSGVKIATDALNTLSNSIKQQADAKVAALEKDKASELNNKNLTAAQKLAIEQKYQKQEGAIKAKAFKEEQELSIIQAIINGAQAVTKVSAQSGVLAPLEIGVVIAETATQVAKIAAQKPPAYAKGGLHYHSDGRGGALAGYSRTDDTNAYLRSGEGIVVSEAMRSPWARNLVSAINVGFGGRDFSIANPGRGYAVGGIFTDGGDANRYYNQPVNDQKNLANSIAYQMVNNFPPVYVDVKDINNQQNILAQTINRVNL